MNRPTTLVQLQLNELMNKDKWHAHDVGLHLSRDRSSYWLPFYKIKPEWLKQTAKQFIYSQAPVRTYSTCRAYLTALISFGCFLTEFNSNITPKGINREIIIDYINYLSAIKQLKPTSVHSNLSGLRRFFEINSREQWLIFSNHLIIYNEDFPKIPKSLPRFIPESVIEQLLKHLHKLQEYHQRLIMIFLETGRRRSEIFTLPYDCLHKDNEGDYFMKVNDRKMAKSYMIPISKECTQYIKEQQSHVRALTSSKEFLFVRKHKNKIQVIKSRPVHTMLNKFSKENNIVDDNGCLWNFHFHQFRHTAATRMINAEVPQHIVQRFLGHESPEMTARYATVHDATLKKEFKKFKKQLSSTHEEDIIEKSLMDDSVLIEYQHELDTTKKLIAMAKLKGWEKQLKMNLKKQQTLEGLVLKLKRRSNNETA